MTVEEYIKARLFVGARAAAARRGWEDAAQGKPYTCPYAARGWLRGLRLAHRDAWVTRTYVVTARQEAR